MTFLNHISSKVNSLKFIFLLLQLIGILFLLKAFNIEPNFGLQEVGKIILVAWIVLFFIPLRYRPFVLLAASFSIIFFAFGWFSGMLFIASASAFFAMLQLKIKQVWKFVLIFLFATVLAVFRLDLFYAPSLGIIAPYLASMFMFRTLLYMYEEKHHSVQATIWQKLSYFFLFPNHCFLLFPIVDYKTFINSYAQEPNFELYQKGIRWMVRGLFHLICYRIIYFYFLTDPSDVTNLTSFLVHISTSYGLIVRLSGIFHLVLGLLCLFGFNLSPIFDNYFLATSFVDLWRRINIYWREFMMKLFFYPIIFKVKRKIKSDYQLPISMSIVFLISWLLHNYQRFWINGSFYLKITDFLFWIILGICVTTNAVYVQQTHFQVKKEYKAYFLNPLQILKMLGLFLFMSLNWSLWSSSSLSDWFFLVSKASVFNSRDIINIVIVIMSIVVIGCLIKYLLTTSFVKDQQRFSLRNSILVTSISISLLSFIAFNQSLGFSDSIFFKYVNRFSENSFNKQDVDRLENGYYTKLIDGENNKAREMWEVPIKKSKTFQAQDEVTIRTNDIFMRKLEPNISKMYNGFLLQSNSFGMRDKEYSITKPKNTFRFVMLGGSYEMGSGVDNKQIFENLVENKLNQNAHSDSMHYEILNFALGAYHLIQNVEVANTYVSKFDPNCVIYFAHTTEFKRIIKSYSSLIRNGIDLKYDFLNMIKKRSGVKQTMSENEINERLTPYAYSISIWGYSEIAKVCKKNHYKAIWVFLPATKETVDKEEVDKLKGIAQKLNFIILDMNGVYANYPKDLIVNSKTDSHPNAFGHKLISESFYNLIQKHRSEIFN